MENVEKLQKTHENVGSLSLTIGIFTQQEMLIFQHQSWYIYPSPEKCGVNPTDHDSSPYIQLWGYENMTNFHRISATFTEGYDIQLVPYYISKFKIKRITAYNTYSWTAHGGSVPYPMLASPAASSPGTMVSSASLTTCSFLSFWRFQANNNSLW